MGGDTTLFSYGMFGTQGVPSVNNYPPAIYSPYCWTDLQGNFWLFGGIGTSGFLGDMWKFNPSTLEWTWVNGTGQINVTPVYGTQLVANAANTPGSRAFSGCTWADSSGNLWLYGGSLPANGSYSDLWKYDITANEWTWMSGDTLINQPAVYGTMGVPSALNNPGVRREIGSSWVDANGKFWLYGGGGTIPSHSDMWLYDPSTNMWAWEAGSQGSVFKPVYGSKGIF